MSDMSSDDFEIIESEDVIKQMLMDEKPDLEKIKKWLNPTDYLASSSEFNRHASSKARNTGEWIRETSQFEQWHSSADHGSIWIKAVPGAGKSVLAASMRAFKDPQVIHASLEEKLMKCDISVFVRQRVKQFAENSISENMQSFIQSTVCERSEGLFLYSRLVLDQISQSITKKEQNEVFIREMILKLTVGLEEMYNRAIEDNDNLSKSDRDSKDIVRFGCGPFLEFMEDGVVQILHHSFTESLLDVDRTIRKLSNVLQFPVIDPRIAHRKIAFLCISKLQGGAFSSYPMPDNAKNGGANMEQSMRQRFDFARLFVQYPLVEYAAKNWTYHAKAYDYEDASFYETLEEFCNSNSQAFQAWSWLADKLRNSPDALCYWLQFSPGQAPTSEMTSHLHIASSFRLRCWTQRLLENGAVVEIRDSTGNTTLFWAAKGGHSKIVSILLDAGANPNIGGHGGLKPIHVTASNNHAGVVRLLLGAGVSPFTTRTEDTSRRCGNTAPKVIQHPLMFASDAGHVETLIEMIPYCNTKELEEALLRAAHRYGGMGFIRGQAALIAAMSSLEARSVKTIIEKGGIANLGHNHLMDSSSVHPIIHSINSPESGDRTPLHNLAMTTINQHNRAAAKEILDMLLLAGADLEARDSNGDTPLLLTVSPKSHRCFQIALELLLSAGAHPVACEELSSTDLAKQLLAFGANPNQARILDGVTPLHCVVDNRHKPAELIGLPVNHGADIDGDTTLHRACRSSLIHSGGLIPAILSLSPDANIQNNLDETCLHNVYWSVDSELVLLKAIAECQDKSMEMVEVLLSHPKKASISARTWQGKTVLHLACHSRNSVELLKILVNHEADLNWTDSTNGNTLLHEVAARFDGDLRDIALIEYLHEKGVSVDAKNHRKQTAAHIMGTVHGNPYNVLIFVLIMAGTELNAQSFNRRTPLHCAARGRQCGVLSMLLNHAQRTGSTIDINAQDSDGMTPLHFAYISGRPESVSILISAGADIERKTRQEAIWKLLQKGKLTELNIQDPFRVLSSHSRTMGSESKLDKATQHTTCRIGISAHMVTKAGANAESAFIPALEAKCAELAKFFDDPHYTGNIADNFVNGWSIIRPRLQVACAELDILDSKGRTPLEIASTYTGNGSASRRNLFSTQCCEALLKLGADSNKVNLEGLTALNKADCDEETIRILLKYAADVNRGTKGVLISAIEPGDVRTLQLYLQNGVDPNVPDNSTDTSYRSQYATVNVARKYPIIVAAFPKGPKAYSTSIAAEMIQLLLDHGARVDLAVEEGESILHYLFANAMSATLRPFFERPGIDMNTRGRYGRTALLCATSNSTKREGLPPHVLPSKLEKSQPPYVPPYLHLMDLRNGTIILSIPGVRSLFTQKDNAGYSPLHRVLSSDSMPTSLTDIVNIFVNDGGADLLEPGPEFNTALHHLARRRPYNKPDDSFRVMEQFLSLGGFIDARNYTGMTPLLVYIAGGGGQSHLPWYEEHDADFKATNNEGQGALHFVAANKPVSHALLEYREERTKARADLFEALVKRYGCEVLDEDSKGSKALDIAAAMGNEEILELFQRRK
ncbi:hypothetical protein EAF00_004655 [Botryotinia globosa]|nr:hypothetical protein EAF00_004655 [Botryotinia globosa]